MRHLSKIIVLFVFIPYLLLSGCKKEDSEALALRKEKAITEQLLLANQYLKSSTPQKGIDLLEELQQANSNHVGILEALGFAYTELEDPALAAFYFEQVVRLDPSLYDHILYAAQAHCDAQAWSSAAENYRLFLEIFPSDASTWKSLAHVLALDKQFKRALKAYLKAFQLQPSPPEVEEALEIGNLFLSINDKAKSKAWYLSTLDQDPKNIQALTSLAQLEYTAENWPLTEKYIGELQRIAPDTIATTEALSIIHDAIEERKEAARQMELAEQERLRREAIHLSRTRSRQRAIVQRNVERSEKLVSQITEQIEVAKSTEFEHNPLNLLSDFLKESDAPENEKVISNATH